jgi:single-strand DNA-binding protein
MGRVAHGGAQDEQPANQVWLRGRVSTPPEERVLPSGTVIVTLRVSVARESSPMATGSRQTADWVDCTAWGAKARRIAARWQAGDVVEVEGSLRRRFQRGASGTSTRLEVEMLSGRVVARAGTPAARPGSSAPRGAQVVPRAARGTPKAPRAPAPVGG